ncbi:hypothetical protein KVT40_000010 [Elsinoe batatas]|uniref:Uncharacterized protein n=1 Tax=Elsinoe batatas TaxID=2601811 RepID=A0A8K0PG15_9PEZI|nr:hypothetical protein KVT40_000010 [Elsinoe batatas]
MVIRLNLHTASDAIHTPSEPSTASHHSILASSPTSSSSHTVAPPILTTEAKDSLPTITQTLITRLLSSASPHTGLLPALGYWQTANAYTATALHDIWSVKPRRGSLRPPGPHPNIPLLQHLLSLILHHIPHCINDFNDDTLWYALLLLHLYTATGEGKYLVICREIYKHVRRFVLPRGARDAKGRDVEGAVLWKSIGEGGEGGCREVNSITTGLWGEFCGLLAVIQLEERKGQGHGDGYGNGEGDGTGIEPGDERSAIPGPEQLVEQAMTSVGFVLATLFRPEELLVLDTLKLDTGEVVEWTFTYTTAQTVAGCIAIHSAALALPDSSVGEEGRQKNQRKRADSLLVLAVWMIESAMRRREWVEDGVLAEYSAYGPGTHDAEENNDAVGFKSVLIRTIGKMYDYLRRLRDEEVEVDGLHRREKDMMLEKMKRFAETTFESVRRFREDDEGRYGPWWAGPRGRSTMHSNMAVMDLMAVMRLMNRDD